MAESIEDTRNVHPVLELERDNLDGTYAELARLLESEPDPNKVYEQLGDKLLDILREQSPPIFRQLIEAQEELDNGEGYVIVRNTGTEASR